LLRERTKELIMNSRLACVLQAMVLTTTASVASPAAQQHHVPLTDQQIAAQVEHRLADREIRGVTVTVRDRTVRLTGTVRNLWAKEEALDEARDVTDVREVVSDVVVMRGESDRTVAEAVAAKLRHYVFFTVFDDVNIEVNDGVATLAGYVTMPYKAPALVTLASRVDGVQRVVDRLETLPVSTFDDQLRYAAAIRIYHDPLFWNYAIQVDPPIHIVVKHGRVTLTGVVLSEVERRKAEQLAREVFGVLSVENKLRLER
jgi:osmotically-inducible protein OsmY